MGMEDLTSDREGNAMTMEATRNQQKTQYKGEKCIFIHNECFSPAVHIPKFVC